MNELNVNRDDELVGFETVTIAIGVLERKEENFLFLKNVIRN